MALLSQQIQGSLLARADGRKSTAASKCWGKQVVLMRQWRSGSGSSSSRKLLRCTCSAIALGSPDSMSGVAGIRWGSVKLQGAREEMEDDLVVVEPDSVDGFSFAAVLDGHGGSSAVRFIRDELYKECSAALQGDLLLRGKDINTIKAAIAKAFMNLDARLSEQLEVNGEEDESGATATVIFVGKNMLITAHIGDSSVVLSRSGKAEVLTSPHRPYGSNKASLQEIRRIREAGGWISNGRICGDIAVSRAFGDIRFKTKKNEMLRKGVEEGRWTEKFVSRVKFAGDLVSACPDIFQVALQSDTEFLILASDGLWDYINSLEAVDFVRDQLRQHGNVQQACDSLARAALDRRSQDNISIVIADLGKTDWRNLPEVKQNVLLEFGQAVATVGIVSLAIWITSQFSV